MKFTLFPKLPLELQLMIWKAALPKGKVVTIDHIMDWESLRLLIQSRSPLNIGLPSFQWNPDLRSRIKMKSDCIIPAMLHACSISRVVTLKHLKPVFAAQLGRPIFFNFQTDILHLSHSQTMRIFCEQTPHFGVSQLHINSIKHLVLSFKYKPTIMMLWRIVETFTKLKLLCITMNPDNCDGPYVEMDREIRGLLRYSRSHILAARASRGEEYEDWRAPTVRLISELDVPRLLK